MSLRKAKGNGKKTRKEKGESNDSRQAVYIEPYTLTWQREASSPLSFAYLALYYNEQEPSL